MDDRPAIRLAHLQRLPDGRQVEWEAIGEGPPLLWIEGGPGLPAHLGRPDVALFTDRFRAYLVNAPGCGRSTRPVTIQDYSLEAHVEWFDAARRALGLDRVTAVGHSWGGLVALAYAAGHPEVVERLIVIDGYAGDASVVEDEAGAERERAFDRIRHKAWFDDALASFLLDDPDETARALDERFRTCWQLYFADADDPASRSHVTRLGNETRWNIDASRAWEPEPPIDLRPALAGVACPTLVIVGEHDFICGPAWARAIAGAMPSAAYQEIPGAGHFPQYEAPDAFLGVVRDWLESTDSQVERGDCRGSGRS